MQDGHVVGIRHEKWVCRYAIPTFFAGDIELFLETSSNQQDTRSGIDRIEIYNLSEDGETRVGSTFDAQEPFAKRVHIRRFNVGATCMPSFQEWLPNG